MSPKQIAVLKSINDAPPGHPKTHSGNDPWKCVEDYASDFGSKWIGGVVYGRFGSSTLRALEKQGAIRILSLGGRSQDAVEVLK
jgi:hypothetical protein